MYIYIYIYMYKAAWQPRAQAGQRPEGGKEGGEDIVTICYPFSQFCEIDISLLSLQKQPNAAPNLFQRGVEYGKVWRRRPWRARRS